MINVSDHHTRVKANSPSGADAPVMGCLLGSQSGRVVDISNSFEIEYTLQDGRVVINEAFLTRKQEQCERALAAPGNRALPGGEVALRPRDACPCLAARVPSATPLLGRPVSVHRVGADSARAHAGAHVPAAPHVGRTVSGPLRVAPPPSVPRDADKQVFPKVDVLGWYVTGAAVEDTHMHIHKRVRWALKMRSEGVPQPIYLRRPEHQRTCCPALFC
jgi:hypothetical protein